MFFQPAEQAQRHAQYLALMLDDQALECRPIARPRAADEIGGTVSFFPPACRRQCQSFHPL
jgi:hypothetical protein